MLVREDRVKRLFNFHNKPMVLLTLDVITLIYSSNIKDVPNIRPKCFCDETC